MNTCTSMNTKNCFFKEINFYRNKYFNKKEGKINKQ